LFLLSVEAATAAAGQQAARLAPAYFVLQSQKVTMPCQKSTQLTQVSRFPSLGLGNVTPADVFFDRIKRQPEHWGLLHRKLAA
jgi:hypothetical protein